MDEIVKYFTEHIGFELIKHTAIFIYEKLHSFTSTERMAREIAEVAKEFERQKIGEPELKRAFAREQCEPLFSRVLIESVYSGTEERRKLFRAVLAGLVKYDDSAELQSRIARSILVLEPSDVAVLREWAAQPTPRPLKDAQISRWDAQSKFGEELSIAALQSALCITHAATGRVVTALGHAVLKYVTSEGE